MKVPAHPDPSSSLHRTATELESFVVKELLRSSGAFKGDASVSGSTFTSELFVDTLAEAVARAGGLGLAPLLEQSLAPKAPTGSIGEVTSDFGTRLDPITGQASSHTGVDLRAPEGTPIPAALDGIVTAAGPRGDYGNAVEVRHPDGFTTLYAHLSEVQVAPGQEVRQGDPVGLSGQTGRTTGPHLHLEVRKGGHPVDPRLAFKAYGLRAESTGGGEP